MLLLVLPLTLSLLLLRAIEHYERSETARVEIPRMLFSLGKMDILEDYVHKSSDEILLKVQPTTLTVILTLSLALPLRQLSTVTIMATASLLIVIAGTVPSIVNITSFQCFDRELFLLYSRSVITSSFP